MRLPANLWPGVVLERVNRSVVQRGDAHQFRPNDEADPVFDRTLREAAAASVGVYAYRSVVSRRGIRIADEISVRL